MEFNKIFHQESMRNYGLEKLSIDLHKSGHEEEKTILTYEKEKLPELKILERISTFNEHDFHYQWALLIFVGNLYNFFTVPYFIGIADFPSSFWLGFEISFEFILLLDLIGRLIFNNLFKTKNMWMLIEDNSLYVWVLLFLASIPYSFISILTISNLNSISVSLIRIGKLFRFFQFFTFFNNIEIIRKQSIYYFIEFFKLILIILASVHYLCTFWLFISRVENLNNADFWLKASIDSGLSNFNIYVNSFFWATQGLTGIILEKCLNYTLLEIGVCIFVMFFGAITFAFIFGRMVAILDKENSQVGSNRERLEIATIWSKQRNLSPELNKRLEIYYKIAREKFSSQIDYKFIDDLPLSLKTEVSLFMFKDLVSKVKLFELGDPAFMMALIRYLKPRLYMSGDFIIRQGDYALEFYIIRVGQVEVLSTDGDTQIALLDEGAYFGEIGILFNVYRTVSVRACEAAIVCYILKENLLQVLRSFPEHLKFLTEVARQRQQCTGPEEIDITYDLMEDSSSDDEDGSYELEPPKFFTEKEHFRKNWVQQFITVPHSNAPSDRFIIDPLSKFFKIWTAAMAGFFTFFLFYVPFAIAFDPEPETFLYLFSVIGYFVFIIDIFVNLKTSIITEFETYSHNAELIKTFYLKKFLLFDIIALVPADLIFLFLSMPSQAVAYFRLCYFFKFYRVKYLLTIVIQSAPQYFSLIRISFLSFGIIFIGHLTGCIFISIGKIRYYYYASNPDEDFLVYNQIHVSMSLFLSYSIPMQYINSLYGGLSIITTSTYSDFYPITTSEKFFLILTLLFSRLFIAFLYAESSSMMGSYKHLYIKHINKVNLVKQWISTTQLSNSLKNRILNYYHLLWRKLHGCNDEEILNDLPEALRTDISYNLFHGLTTSGLFPESDSGAILSIVRRCKVEIYCEGETIINQGELGLEMYFVMEGVVKVVTSLNVVLNVLKKGNFFGEIALIKPIPDVRQASVVAQTDVTLAMLSLDDYKYVSSIYPEFADKVMKKAAEREGMNRSTFQKENLEAIKEYHKLVNEIEGAASPTTSNLRIDTSLDQGSLIHLIPVPDKKYIFDFLNSKIKNFVYAFVVCWNIVFLPLKIAFDYEYQSFMLFFEIISIIVYSLFAIVYVRLYIVIDKNTSETMKLTKKKCALLAVYQSLLAVPFALIGEVYSLNSSVIAFFCLIRISNFYMIFPAFSKLKENISWFITLSSIEIILIYISMNHIIGCYFIYIAKTYDILNSWISPYIGSRDFTVYINAFYWADSTFSHSNLGDIFSINTMEKIFNILIFMVSGLIYSLLFGYISSLVSGFASQLKSNLQDSYLYVKNFVKKKKVDRIFSGLIEDYYNYVWHNNKGIPENEILNGLPHSIKSSIQIYIFSKSILSSQVFKDSTGKIDYNITQSLFRIMAIQCYLVGDTIIKVGDKKLDMYIILEGEVDVVNIQGKKVLATLSEGAHFGEANIILKNEMRTATIIATKISKIGILSKQQLEMLFEAYPEWYSMLENIVRSRMQETFNSVLSEDITKQCLRISKKLQTSPKSYNKYTKRSEKLMAPKIAELNLKTSAGKWITLSFLHLALIIYSGFSIPLIIGFGVQMNSSLLLIEAVVISESLVFLCLNCKESLTVIFKKKMSSRKLLIYLYKNFALEDLAAISPFHLLFGLISNLNQIYVIPLRLLRLFSLFRINSLLEKLEMFNRNLVGIIKFFRILVALGLVMHWCSCCWGFVSSLSGESNWVNYNKIEDQSLGVKYEYSLYYVMNLISSTGHNNTFPINEIERVFSVFFSLIGFILFAVYFGLMASVSQLKVTDLQEMINNINSPFSFINKTEIPNSLINRLEQYYAFTTGLTQNIGPVNFKNLYSHLPPNIVGTIIYECNKSMLKKLPFLAQLESTEMIERISLCLIPQIYLPNDFIIYKNDIGEEMFFIILGAVNILGPDNHKVVKSLRKGDFFGEVALLTDAPRMCSVVSHGLSLIYALNKLDFLLLLEDFPDIVGIIQQEAMKRKIESKSIKKEREQEENNAEIQEDLVQTINMYSSMSSPFFMRKNSPKKLSLLAGMKHYTAEVIKESYNNTEPHKLNKRRPRINVLNEKRLSQESLGKEVVLSKFSKLKMKWSTD